MRILEINEQLNRRLYLAGEYLHEHRIAIVLGAFVFWTIILTKLGFFQEFGETKTGLLIFGFFWMTIPMSLATYFIPRLMLKFVPIMNGYKHQEQEE